ncbi:MAG: hypothetical protein IIC78_13395 [Chloroflexi bacterium]|nr:hypothetical protein [Chloroflexota bacterium]
MATQKSRLKGISRKELRTRIAIKRAKKLWHFGLKRAKSSDAIEPIDVMVRKLRFG